MAVKSVSADSRPVRIAPPVPPADLMRLASADADFEAALAKLELKETAGVTIFAQAMPEVVLVPPDVPLGVNGADWHCPGLLLEHWRYLLCWW